MFNCSVHKAILFIVMFLFMVAMAEMANASPSKDIEPDSAARAKSFMQEHRAAFGIKSDALNLVTKQTRTKNKRKYVRFRQTYDNLPVFGAEVIVQLNESGNVTYVLSDVMRHTKRLDNGSLSVSPTVSAQDAQQIALDQVSHAYPDTYINVDDAVLVIYRPAVVGNTGFTRLVWQTIVTGSTTVLIKELILIDAHNGKIALQFSQIKHAKNRQVFDSKNTPADPGALARSEGDLPSGITDVDDVYDFLGDTYDFYFNQHGRDGINGAGSTLSATVRYCAPGESCPYVNAFWTGTRMYYGEGMGTDDITAHELTHGVTQYESGLIYLNEAGAISESFSDMWGEFVDLTNGAGTDTPEVRWYMGEDAPMGAIRNMANPPEFNDPDRKGSPLWHYGSSDNGGVHTNSGVANKLCYLLADGDTFNDHTITGIGIFSTADLFYEVQSNLLTQSSDYADLYDALIQAAINLGWSAADQDNVNEACLAVELDYTPPVPANDECIDANSITEGIAVNGTTIGATDSGIKTSCAGDDTYDVWYSYTPTVTGDVTVSLCGSDYDSALAIFDSCGGLELACNDDSCDLNSEITAGMTAGATYMIRVSGWDGAIGNFILLITGPPQVPPNDECIDAISVTEGIAVIGTTIGATDSGIRTSCAINDRYDVWYSYTPTVTDDVTVSLCGSDYDTALAIFDSCGGVELACNNDSCGLQSEITAGMTAGTTYMIRVSGHKRKTGDFILLITRGISGHVRQISMSTTYDYTTNPILYTFDADVDLHASHSVKEISVQRPDGQTYAMTLDNSDPSEPYYEFGASSNDLSDLVEFDSGLFTFTITYTDDSTETTSVLYANPNNGQPIAPVTQEPVLDYPVDGQTDVPLKMGFLFDACTHPDWTIGIECEPQDGSAPALEGSLPYDATGWGVWNWDGASLLPNKTYDAELNYNNAYWGTNADGIPFVVDKDAELNITFTTTSDTSASVSDHVFFLEISKGIDYNDPRWPASKRYDFDVDLHTDDTIEKIEFVTPGNDIYVITQVEDCNDYDLLGGYKVCTEYEADNGWAGWSLEMYALQETGTDPFGDGQYLIKFYYSDTEYYQTTIDYTVPITGQPIPQPTQKPNITSPGNVTLVPSSFTMHWDLCTDAAVNNIHISLEDDYRGLEYDFDFSPDTTSSPLVTPMHGPVNGDIEFEHEYFVPDNGDRIPLTIGKYSSINHRVSVSRYDTINMQDFAGLAAESGRTDCDEEANNGCNGYDLDNYGQVDIRDMARLVETWLTFTEK